MALYQFRDGYTGEDLSNLAVSGQDGLAAVIRREGVYRDGRHWYGSLVVRADSERQARSIHQMATRGEGYPPYPKTACSQVDESEVDTDDVLDLSDRREITQERGGVETLTLLGGTPVDRAWLLSGGAILWERDGEQGIASEGYWRYVDQRPQPSNQ